MSAVTPVAQLTNKVEPAIPPCLPGAWHSDPAPLPSPSPVADAAATIKPIELLRQRFSELVEAVKMRMETEDAAHREEDSKLSTILMEKDEKISKLEAELELMRERLARSDALVETLRESKMLRQKVVRMENNALFVVGSAGDVVAQVPP